MTKPTAGRITVKPEIALIEELLNEIRDGRLRVPKFQRPFVWRPEQMTELFDSIERGYPIGSLLIWETDLDMASLDHVGGLPVPSAPRGKVAYLLDGHQRLSTLYGCLMPRTEQLSSGKQSDWMWNIYRALDDEFDSPSDRVGFRHWKRSGELPPEHFFPMRSALRTMDFLSFARRLEKSKTIGFEAMIDRAEEIAQRIKSYQTAVVRLVGGDLERAVRCFQRLNSSGQTITPDQMASALTYTKDTSQTLADNIGALQESIADSGFGDIASITIYRSILAVAGEDDVLESRWDALGRRVKDTLTDAVEATNIALPRAVNFLRETAEVPLAKLVPYNPQIMLLVAFFDRNPSPSDDQVIQLRRWFWTTSWSGYFAGANSTQIKNSLHEMREFASRKKSLDLSGQVSRPFPDRFDTRSARVRSFLVWELSEFANRKDIHGDTIDAIGLIGSSERGAYRHILPNTPSKSSPANRIILPTPPRMTVRQALSSHVDQAVAESHGIPHEALDRLKFGDTEGFIRIRAAFLMGREREFMSTIGIELSSEPEGEADIDTE